MAEPQLAKIESSPLYSPDLAPVPAERRKWGMLSFAALWISMSACVPTYMLASGLISDGMNWWQAIVTIFIANVIVLIPMMLNAHAGTLYGIPFPVYCRASFGTLGANVPAVLRALVACGWFGIQTWIGGEAIYKICLTISHQEPAVATNWLGVTGGQFLCFLLFWGINMWVIYRGIDTIRFLLNIKAPLLIALGLLFLWWAYDAAGGWGPMLSKPSAFDAGQPKAGKFWISFFPALTGMVGFWATLSLNIPDFSRYAKSQRDQALGQAIGLPDDDAPPYAFIGVAVTSATTIIFGKTIWDPVDVLTHFKNPVLLVIVMLALCMATLATNIAANVVSPANDFAQLAPKHITFRIGGFITGVVGILMMPWKLLANPESYIFQWLGGYGALLGPIGGILIADYFVWRKRKLDLVALYQPNGEYRYTNGYSWAAIIALVVGILPNLPGFLVRVHQLNPANVPALLVSLFDYAWFVGFGLAFAVYLVLRSLAPRPAATSQPAAV